MCIMIKSVVTDEPKKPKTTAHTGWPKGQEKQHGEVSERFKVHDWKSC